MHPPHWSSAFHLLITLFEEKYCAISLVHLTFLSLQEWPLVPLLFVSISNSSYSATELYPRYITKTSIISCLFRRSSNVHYPNDFFLHMNGWLWEPGKSSICGIEKNAVKVSHLQVHHITQLLHVSFWKFNYKLLSSYTMAVYRQNYWFICHVNLIVKNMLLSGYSSPIGRKGVTGVHSAGEV